MSGQVKVTIKRRPPKETPPADAPTVNTKITKTWFA